jgi:predicted P-loop ATPase
MPDPIAGFDYGRCKARLYVNENGSIIISSKAHGGRNFRLQDPAEAENDFAEFLVGLGDGSAAGTGGSESEQLAESLRQLLASDAKLKAAWASGAKLTGGDDTSPRSLDFSLTVYLARREHDDELITLALRHYPHGQIGRGELNGGNAAKRLAKLLEEAEKIRAKAGRGGEAEAWRPDLLLTEKGTPRDCLANGGIILRQDPVFVGRVRFDELRQGAVSRDMPWLEGSDWRDWADNDDIRFAEWCQLRGVPLTPTTAAQAVAAVADDHRFHPVREYLEGLVWDGVPRLDTWLATYLGVSVGGDEPETKRKYLQEVGRRWPIAAVARIYRPGCKVDTSPIFEGSQGAGKSQALAALVPNRDWFTDEIADIGSKDSAQDLRGKWIIELAELSAMGRGSIERTKAFMSRGIDHYRPSYGRRAMDFPRQCVFGGTTNADTYLADETGGRRFWPVKVGKIDLETIRRDRDQLWAEAVAAFKAGEKWWLNAEGEKAAGVEQAERRIQDPWDETVMAWAEMQTGRVTREAALVVVGVPKERQDQIAANRIARIFRTHGWVRQRETVGKREWGYVRPEPSQSAGPSQSAEDILGRKKASNGAARPSVPVRPSMDETSEDGLPPPAQEGGAAGGGVAETVAKPTGTTGTDWDGRTHPRGHHAANGHAFDFPPAFDGGGLASDGTPGHDPYDLTDLLAP